MDDPDRDGVPDADTLRVLSRADLESEVRKRTAELQNVMDTMADVLVTLDPTGHIEMANEAVTTVLGYDPETLEGRPFSYLLATPDRDGDADRHGGGGDAESHDLEPAYSGVDLVERLVSEGEVTDLELRFETVDGDVVPVQLSASVMRAGDAVTGYVCVAKDVTERVERERELERKNEFLDEFASVVSHDIATPLTVIENKARLVEMTGDTSHAEDIYEATERVETLVDELRTLASQGERVGETEPVDLEAVAGEAWRSVEAPAATLTVAASTTVEADRERLRQLLENLLRNAVEHGSTSPGPQSRRGAGKHGSTNTRQDPGEGETADDDPVTVRVGALEDGFYVADDGPGIPPGKREQVFEQGFSTSDDGTGLGLAIVRRIVEGHGWTVDVTDSDDGGARFEVRTD